MGKIKTSTGNVKFGISGEGMCVKMLLEEFLNIWLFHIFLSCDASSAFLSSIFFFSLQPSKFEGRLRTRALSCKEPCSLVFHANLQ